MQYPDFLTTLQYAKLDESKSTEEKWMALAENIKRIHQLSSRHYDDFGQLIHDYLEAGIEIFQMQTGIVSHITDDKDYIIKDVISPLDVIHPDDVYPLEGTYCREVYKSHKTLGFPHVGEMHELKEHPVYVNLRLEAYISAPIYVHDTIYGTLNFTSTEPRTYGFSEHEHDLISMMAQSIGNFILLKEREDHLKELNFRMKELIGHVAHDLRNPLGGIREIAELATHRQPTPEKMQKFFSAIKDEAGRTLEYVNRILDEAALGTGKIRMNRKHFNFDTALQHAVSGFSTLLEQRNIAIVIEGDCRCDVYADQSRIEQLLKNLISNAAKYAQHSSMIDIGCNLENDTFHFYIKNSLGGRDATLDESLYKSVGFGLDIVDEILKQHGSRLEQIRSAHDYEVRFTLSTKES